MFLGIENFLRFEWVVEWVVEGNVKSGNEYSGQVLQSLNEDIVMSSPAICARLGRRQVSPSQTSHPKPWVIFSPSKAYAL
jgi:hypothetical protein